MVYTYYSMILQRFVLPIALVLCALIRPVGISFAYLLMFFISPFIPVAANPQNFRGSVRPFYLILIAISSLLLLGHIILQIVNVISVIGECTFTELLLRHIGFIKLSNLREIAVVEWLMPDLVILTISISSYFLLRLLALKSVQSSNFSIESGTRLSRSMDFAPKYSTLIQISPFLCLVALFFAAVLRPSVPGGFYFLVFLIAGSYLASFNSFSKNFVSYMRLVMAVLVMHIMLIVSYQTPWTQESISNSSLTARLIGLEPLVKSTCEKDIRVINYEIGYTWPSFVNPLVILLCYYILSLTTKNFRHVISSQTDRLTQPTETTPLVRHDSLQGIQAVDSFVDSDEQRSSCFDQICYGIASICGFIYQNSYIFTNVLMMTWSIVYHSWLTFVLLIWANVLWMIPNQRKAMMRSSPLIVFYAEFLLIAQYIYGMNLTNEELPSKVNTTGINLLQIGLEKPRDTQTEPCIPLIVKTLFLLMFWITLRQFFKEKHENQQKSAIRELVSPIRVTVNAATRLSPRTDKKSSKFLKKAGDVIKNLLVRLWIWLLILVIFLCAITGKKMTGFRICYMALFLFFLLVFQSSSKAWVKIMYGFWLFLIFYAMSILILIYTYQFDKFDIYWNTYLNISLTLQKDIGLEKYKTKDLFLHLVSPTIIVILTAIQVHYFHRRFVSSLQQRNTSRQPNTPSTSRKSDQSYNNEDQTLFENIINCAKHYIRKFAEIVKKFARNFKNLFWRFLEIHLIKAVYLSAFIACCTEICLLHLGFVILCIIGVLSNNKAQIVISRLISFAVSIIILSKMIYQAGYLQQENYDAQCPKITTNENRTLDQTNNAVWFGLEKITPDHQMIELIRYYIIYMIMVTLHAIVNLRCNQMKLHLKSPEEKTPMELFPGVTRLDSEKNLSGMIKYLFNYGFYRLGIEITLIMLVSLIAYRQDIVAIVYVVWLCIFLPLDRKYIAKIWTVFQYFTGSFILFQYVVMMGLPPGLCLEFPWDNWDMSNNLQLWALVPGKQRFSFKNRLICDFILLLLIGFQKVAFHLEKTHANDKNFPGGSNESVVHNIENIRNRKFYNETADFLGQVRNYLDISKNIVFCGLYWVTLAFVFFTGSSVVDAFSIGYLIGSFIFLWQGSDFYLLPIRVILRSWKLFLLYIVIVISLKTCVQIGGCLFFNEIENKFCVLVHLWGLSCATSRDHLKSNVTPEEELLSACPAVRNESNLAWDTACFALALFQLRIFKSHYFCHIINDTKANRILGSRGAEIIEDLRQKQIEHQKVHEQEILRKIKRKMEKIRATQQRMFLTTEKPTHYDENGIPIPVHKQRRAPIKYHPNAVRAGDYYMFDDMDEKFELDLIEDEVDYLEDNGNIDESEKKLNRKKSLYHGDAAILKDTDSSDKLSDDKDVKKDKSKDKKAKEKTDAVSDDTENPIKKLALAFLISVAIRINRWSRNYRYVVKILAKEKNVLKDSAMFGRLSHRPQTMWSQLKRNILSEDSESPSNPKTQHTQIDTNEHDTDIIDVDNTDDIIELKEIGEPSTSSHGQPDKDMEISNLAASEESDYDSYEGDFAARDHYIIVEVLISTWFAILSNTDIICYIVIIINQIFNASLISLPLPLMVFLWGTLSLPRPTKTFWITLIAYTQSLVLVKTLFQYKIFWTNYSSYSSHPLSATKLIGIDLKTDYAYHDLFVLLALFFHRFILKTQGIWDYEYQEEHVPDGVYVLKDEYINSDDVDDDIISKKNVDHSAVVVKNNDTFVFQQTSEDLKDDELNVRVINTLENPSKYVPEIVKITSIKYLVPSKRFFHNLTHKSRLPTDVYALMFLCDFVNFFVLLFGFSAFGSQQGDGDVDGVSKYISENKVPTPFLILLFLQFILIVIDRALYLRKALVLKIAFHFFSVIEIHLWMFFVIPSVTERSFYASSPPIVFYLFKCFYLLFSSYQIKCGYPKRILGNFLTKGFSLVNMITFKIYMLIPFLYELRTILDWVCTDTTMTLFDWLKMEDIFADIFFIKCSRQMESDFPAIRSTKKPMYTKLLLGGFIIGLIVMSIWAPLTFFALGHAVGQSNIPYQVSAEIRIGPYEPIYSIENRESIFPFDKDMYEKITGTYYKNTLANSFLSNYDAEDIAVFVLAGNSPSLWEISPPDKQKLLQDLVNNHTLTCQLTISLKRTPNSNSLATISLDQTFIIDANFSEKQSMIDMLQGSNTDKEIQIPYFVPKFLKVINTGKITAETPLSMRSDYYRSIFLKLVSEVNSNKVWWEVRESCNDTFHKNVLSQLPYAKRSCQSGLSIYTFNDKKFPSTFNKFAASGILGMYTTMVLVFSRLLKIMLTGQSKKIMFVDLPNVDRVLQLCLDIYLVREALEFTLEEDLFAKLIFLYRSPETMIKWTRPKDEFIDDDESEDDDMPSPGPSRQQTPAVEN